MTEKKKTTRKTKGGAKKNSSASTNTKSQTDATDRANLRLVERRRHPRFLLSREQFREIKTGKTFPVYDLSMNGLSIRSDEQYWPAGSLMSGVLNIHPESIEVTTRLLGYYGDRAALRLESVSTYARSVLEKALSPKRLGQSLHLVREHLPLADYWYHGVCNTDVLLRLNGEGKIAKAEVFFSNSYWSWTEHSDLMATGVCQSIGEKEREATLIAEEPVKLESVSLEMDGAVDPVKVRWAKGILESAPLEPLLK
ncbi:MAG TPA: PilZ domain-containing protein, partial [Oligoflexia bacterium]|nr:PilZ domain-containing protein [Oligoflexia bacterium]